MYLVEANSLVRLWKRKSESVHVHELIPTDDGRLAKKQQILDGIYHKKYLDWPVIGVTDILSEAPNEAVNIVIDTKGVK